MKKVGKKKSRSKAAAASTASAAKTKLKKSSKPKLKATSKNSKKKSAAPSKKSKATEREKAAANQWHLKLYVAGQTGKSEVALRNLEQLCETHLKGLYQLEVIDLLKQPQLAKGDQIFAIPTLIKKVPKPVRKIIGDLSDAAKVLVGLNLKPIGQE